MEQTVWTPTNSYLQTCSKSSTISTLLFLSLREKRGEERKGEERRGRGKKEEERDRGREEREKWHGASLLCFNCFFPGPNCPFLLPSLSGSGICWPWPLGGLSLDVANVKIVTVHFWVHLSHRKGFHFRPLAVSVILWTFLFHWKERANHMLLHFTSSNRLHKLNNHTSILFQNKKNFHFQRWWGKQLKQIKMALFCL